MGVNAIIESINGFIALAQREDAVKELIRRYSDFPILEKIQKEPASKDYHIPYKLPFIELILSNNEFLGKFDCTKLEELRMIALKKYEDKLKNIEVYSLFNIKKTMLLLATIIDRQNSPKLSPEQKDMITSFIKHYNHCSYDLLTEISKIIIL